MASTTGQWTGAWQFDFSFSCCRLPKALVGQLQTFFFNFCFVLFLDGGGAEVGGERRGGVGGVQVVAPIEHSFIPENG